MNVLSLEYNEKQGLFHYNYIDKPDEELEDWKLICFTTETNAIKFCEFVDEIEMVCNKYHNVTTNSPQRFLSKELVGALWKEFVDNNNMN